MNPATILLIVGLLLSAAFLGYTSLASGQNQTPQLPDSVQASSPTPTPDTTVNQQAGTPNTSCDNFLTKTDYDLLKKVGFGMCYFENLVQSAFLKIGMDPFRFFLWATICLLALVFILQLANSGSSKLIGFLIVLVVFFLGFLLLGLL